MDRGSFIGTLLLLLAGLLIWVLHFLFIYAFNTLACTRVFADTEILGYGSILVAVIIGTILAMSAAAFVLAFALFRIRRLSAGNGELVSSAVNTDHFLYVATAGVAFISLVAILWNAIPVFLVPPCG